MIAGGQARSGPAVKRARWRKGQLRHSRARELQKTRAAQKKWKQTMEQQNLAYLVKVELVQRSAQKLSGSLRQKQRMLKPDFAGFGGSERASKERPQLPQPRLYWESLRLVHWLPSVRPPKPVLPPPQRMQEMQGTARPARQLEVTGHSPKKEERARQHSKKQRGSKIEAPTPYRPSGCCLWAL